MRKLYVADRECGNIIDEVKTIEEGKELIAKYEAEDKVNGNYEPNFYDIVDGERCSVLTH